MKLVSKRTLAALSVAAVSVVGLGSAQAAGTEHQVRAADIVTDTAHQDVDATYEFLKEGIHVKVDDTTQFVRALFPTNVPLADVHTVAFDWFGTGYGTQGELGDQVAGNTGPVALRYNVDVDGDGSWDCQLVGERAYGGTDVWLNKDSEDSPEATLPDGTCADYAPVDGGGSGSEFHGDLDQWAASLATVEDGDGDPVVVQAGFVGSDALSDGVLRSISLGDDVYSFTNEADPNTPVDVKANFARSVSTNKFQLTFTSAALPAGATQGSKVIWQVKIGNEGGTLYGRMRVEQGAGETSVFTERFVSSQPRQAIQVLKDGKVVGSYLATPS